MRISRSDRSRLAQWWFTVDLPLLTAILAIIAAGIVLSLAASPAVAMKKGLPTYYFVERQLFFSGLGVVVMLAVSLMRPAAVRRLALAMFAAALIGLVTVLLVGAEINGARRWLSVAGHSFQPSEIMKPAFTVLSAWAFAQAQKRPDMPALALAIGSWVIVAGLLLAEPDVGQTLLLSLVWGALYFLSGQPLIGAAVLAACGAAGLGLAAYAFPHVRFRFAKYLSPTPGDNSQIDRAMQSFVEGGFFGRGPGEGTIKTVLPDAHTDFIFAVVAEEYGVVTCLILLAMFGFVVVRALIMSRSEPEAETRHAIEGLALLFGLQALINMGVNVGLLPAKGMTLPFISAGGSSTLAVSVTLGMLLALTRRRADVSRLKKPRLMPSIEPLPPQQADAPPGGNR